MHELSIALGIVDAAEGEARKRGGPKIAAVHVKIGALSGVVPDALRSAFELAREGSSLAAAELVVQPAPVVAFCPTCEDDREIPSIQEMCCPECGTPTPLLVSGRELEVVALEIES